MRNRRRKHSRNARALFGAAAFGAVAVLAAATPARYDIAHHALSKVDATGSRRVSGGTESPIADAVMRGDSNAVRLLLKQGNDANAAQPDGMTALHWAAARGDAKLANMLIFAGARLEAATRNGTYTPLHLAAKSGRASTVKALLAAGANANAATTSGGATPLHFAADQGNTEVIAALIERGAKVNAKETAFGQTPLMWAASSNRAAAVELLIAKGADFKVASKIEDISAREKAERTALGLRARRVAAMKSADAPPRGPGAPGNPTDATGGRGGRGGAVAIAPPAGVTTAAPANGAPGANATAASPATGAAAAASASAMPGAAMPVTAAGNSAAAPAGAETAAGRGGRGGAATAAPDSTGGGRINSGGSYGDLVGNKGGLTPLLFAVRQGSVESVQALLKAGADINQVSEGDHTSPLLMATINGRFDLAKLLLDKGANAKVASDAGATPLYTVINAQWAAKSLYPQPTAQLQQKITYLELMESLLKAGADVNARLTKHLWYMSFNFDLLGVNTTGATPFWRAAYGTDVDAMKLLMKYGADPMLPTLKPAGRQLNADASPDDAATDPNKDPSGLPPIPANGPGVFALQAASGVGYGEGFAANSHRHAPDGWLPAVKYLVEELHMDVNSRDFNGYTPVHHAAARGDTVLIAYLVSKGADVKAISRKGQTTADMANGPVQRTPPFLETVDFLVRLGAKNNNKCKSC